MKTTHVALALFAVASFSTACASVADDGESPVSSSSEDLAENDAGKASKDARTCPPTRLPVCSVGVNLVQHQDEIGCTSFTCDSSCPEVDVPTCSPNESLNVRSDDKGCSVAYCE